MKDNLTPNKFIIKISKLKYKEAIIPISFIALTFFLNLVFKIEQTKYFALLGLAYYLVILLKYKINKPTNDYNKNEIISPISGKILNHKKVENYYYLKVKKNYLHTSDVRAFNNNIIWEANKLKSANIEVEFKQGVAKFDCNNFNKGMLLGLLLKPQIIEIRISNKIKLNNLNTLKSGETIIGYYEEK